MVISAGQGGEDDLFEPAGPPPPQLGPIFSASFDGECPVCGWEIETGDPIRADLQGDFVHAACAE